MGMDRCRTRAAGRDGAVVIGAAVTYFAIVFASGFVLGAVRMLVVAPVVGALAAVAIELPLMLGVSLLAAGWVMRRFTIAAPNRALAMGVLAFGLLMVAEVLLATALGATVAEWAYGLVRPEGLLGLGGQLLFALIPWWLAVRRRGGGASPLS